MKWFLLLLLAATGAGWVRDRRGLAASVRDLCDRNRMLTDALVYESNIRQRAAEKRAKWHAESYLAGYGEALADLESTRGPELAVGGAV